MELAKRLHEPDVEESNSNGGASETSEPSSPPPDLIDFSFPQLPAAEETEAAGANIFLLGRLLPYEFPQPTLLPHLALQRADMEKPRLPPFIHRRADSLDDEHDCRRRGEAQTIDYQQLTRASSDPRPAPAAGARRRWPLLVLGSVKFPAEMEINDIRNRQRRRGPLVVVSEVVEHGRRKSHWSILRALSCKAAENTAIVPPGATIRAGAASSCRALSCKAAENTAILPPGATIRATAASSCFAQGIYWIPKLLSPHN